MNSTSPLVSVILPAYNTEAYLPRCLDSVLCQTLSDFELLLIDDGSTDGTGAIADRYAEADSRVRVIHKENGGVSSARNHGLKVAQGEFITFVDSDDIVLPTYLEKLHTALSETEADISVANWGGPDGRLAYHLSKPCKTFSQNALNDLTLLYICCAHMFRRSSMTVFRFAEDIQYAEDALFTTQNFYEKAHGTLIALNEHLYIYDRTNPVSVTMQRFQPKRLSEVEAYHRIQKAIEAYPAIADSFHKHQARLLWNLYCMMITSGGAKKFPVESETMKKEMRENKDLLKKYLTPRARAVCTLSLHCEWLARPLIQVRERKIKRKISEARPS